MATDPAPFLSTVILASAALVAIIGGLLVGRFVSIDSEQQGSQKLLDDATGRLKGAEKRAEEARKALRRRRCHDFLGHRFVLDHIDRNKTDLEELRGLAATGLTDAELKHLVLEVQDEFKRAREALRAEDMADRIRGGDTERAAAALGDLNTSWPEVWRKVYFEIASGEYDQQRREKEAALRDPKVLADSLKPGPRRLALPESAESATDRFLRARGWETQRSVGSEIEARRDDQAVAAVERSSQRVEDLEGEHERLLAAHKKIVRPDRRLWWGMIVLVGFAAIGVAWPMLEMSRGPTHLAQVHWFVWLFLGALLALLIYVVTYLATITRRGRTSRRPDDEKGTEPSGRIDVRTEPVG